MTRTRENNSSSNHNNSTSSSNSNLETAAKTATPTTAKQKKNSNCTSRCNDISNSIINNRICRSNNQNSNSIKPNHLAHLCFGTAGLDMKAKDESRK